jgi:spermidine synthase
MKAWELLGESSSHDGIDLQLRRRDDEYLILANGKPLMSSRLHGSEEALATLGCSRARALAEPRVLVGGLGMGFTLRAVLDVLPLNGVVTVAELVPAVIEWNRSSLAALAGYPLRDRRVRIQAADVGFTLRANPGRFDVVLLDTDNGPAAFTAADNAGLYDNAGVAAAFAALRPGGTLAVWSAWEDRKFEQRLRFHGFRVEVARVRARLHRGGPRHAIFVAHKSLPASA